MGFSLIKLENLAAAAEGEAAEVTTSQASAEQIFASEACVKAKAGVVVECGAVKCCAIFEISPSRVPIEIRSAANNHAHFTTQPGGAGELLGLQLAHLRLETIHPGGEHGELGVKLVEQLLQLVGDFADPIEAGIEQGGRFVAGHGVAALEFAVGIAGHAAVLLHQVAQRLVGPVGGQHIGKLVDAGDLVFGFPGTEAINVLLLHVFVDGSIAVQRGHFICGSGHGGHHTGAG